MFLELKKQLKSNYIFVLTILILFVILGIFVYLLIKNYYKGSKGSKGLNESKDSFGDTTPSGITSPLQIIPDDINITARSKGNIGYDLSSHDLYDLQYNFRSIALNNNYMYLSYNVLKENQLNNSNFISAGSASGTNIYLRIPIDSNGIGGKSLHQVNRNTSSGFGGSALRLLLNKDTIICNDSYRYGRYINTIDFNPNNIQLIQTAFSPAIDILTFTTTSNYAFFIPWNPMNQNTVKPNDPNIYYISLDKSTGKPLTTNYSSYNLGLAFNNNPPIVKQICSSSINSSEDIVWLITKDIDNPKKNNLYRGRFSKDVNTFDLIVLEQNISCKTISVIGDFFIAFIGNNINTKETFVYYSSLDSNKLSTQINKFYVDKNENFIDICITPKNVFVITEQSIYFAPIINNNVQGTLKFLISNPNSSEKFYQIYANDNSVFVLYESGRIGYISNITDLIISITPTLPSTTPAASTTTTKSSQDLLTKSITDTKLPLTTPEPSFITQQVPESINQLKECSAYILDSAECLQNPNCYLDSTTCFDKKDNFSLKNYADLDKFCKYSKENSTYKISCNLENYSDQLLLAKFTGTPVHNTYIKKMMTDNNIIFDSKDSRVNNLVISNGVLKNNIQIDKISDKITMQDINGDLISFKLSDKDQLSNEELNIQNTEQIIYNSNIQNNANNLFFKIQDNLKQIVNDINNN